MQVKFTSYPTTSYPVASLPIDDAITWQFWGKWMLAVLAVLLIFLLTVEVAPFMHGDEFMIVDLGRILLHPDTEWSITWLTNKNEPVFAWFYLGPVLQEASFQVLGQYGPRLSGLIGALMAATMMVGWLLARGSSQKAAFLLGLVFLLDPLFVQAYTMGRVDGWTMALCIGSCWILRTAIHGLSQGKSFHRHVILAGALAILAFFTWPSAVFLFPLIFLELFCLVNRYKAVNGSWQKVVFLFGLGSCLAGLVLILPIASHIYVQFSNLLEGLKTNMRSGPTWGEQSGYLRKIAPFIELLRTLKFTPVLVLTALVAAISRRQVGLALAVLVATGVMLGTLVYIHRVQYLLPYFVVLAAGIFGGEAKLNQGDQTFARLLRFAGIALLLIWPVALSLCIRSALALDGRAERDRSLLSQAARSLIGPGNHSVFAPYEFYYVGRSLGWKMYKPYLAVGEPLSPENWQPILPHVDFVMVYQEGMTAEAIQRLHEEGMRAHGGYYSYDNTPEKDNGRSTNIERLRNLYSIFRKPYGPYTLYVRENYHTAKIRN